MTGEETAAATPNVPPAGDGVYPDWDEVASTYAPRDWADQQRWVVVFIASVDLEDDDPDNPPEEDEQLPSPHRAAAEALDLIRGEGSAATNFAVWDRRDQKLHHLRMADFDPELLEFAQVLPFPARQDVDVPAPQKRAQRPPGTRIVDSTQVAEYDVDGVKVLVTRETWNGGAVSFEVTASFWTTDGVDLALLTEDESLDHEPDLDEVRALMVNHIQDAAEEAEDSRAADGATTAE